ncbi:MAG: DUF1223 domain-containing protein [Gammaproteobacteria bacterium]|nr:DUF1223 domain-containing protein [Gammaproteobacteria bacterium]MCP5196640.1 DUF1223 domain-containing protein [Gammaproteobacteria bacterium]
MKTLLLAMVLTAALIWGHPLSAEITDCTTTSPYTRTALVELYTSEGCNSCPPADRWLSRQSAQDWNPRQIVALAFHVDYWDRLGWKDRFAQPAFSTRQRALAAQQGSRTVYTPQVLVSGRSLSQWRWPEAFQQRIADITAQPAPVDLQIELFQKPEQWQIQTTGQLHATVTQSTIGIFVAVYQDKLGSQVIAGENAGEHLRHDRVVRALLGPLGLDPNGHFSHTVSISLPDGFVPQNAGVAVFLQQIQDGEVLQALALPACPS